MHKIQARWAHNRKKAAWRGTARGWTAAQGADQSGAAAAAAAEWARSLAVVKKPGNVSAVFDVEGRLAARIPMMAWSAACGFPSPAKDYVDRPLDFNELLIEHPAATFAIRIEGDSMTGAGIFPGDIAVVDRAREPVNGNIVLALLDGAFTVKRYRVKDGAVWLQAENPAFKNIQISDEQTFEVWGVITRSIRML